MDANHLASKQRLDFETNYLKYRRGLYACVMSIVRNKTAADEITDDTIARVYASLEKRRWEVPIENFPAYLAKSARRRSVRWMVLQRVETSLDEFYERDEQEEQQKSEPKAMQDHDATPRMEREIYYKELLRQLPKAITSDVTDYEWQLLHMHEVEEMGAEAIAETLGKDPDAIKYKINTVRAKLRYRARKSGGTLE